MEASWAVVTGRDRRWREVSSVEREAEEEEDAGSAEIGLNGRAGEVGLVNEGGVGTEEEGKGFQRCVSEEE